MNKKIVLGIAILLNGFCFAQNNKIPDNKDQAKKQEQVKSLSSTSKIIEPKGPIGLGSIKIGMSKESIEALTAISGVYVTTPMTPYVYKYSSPKAGEDKFDTSLLTPLSENPIKSVLTFDSNKLVSLSLDLDGSDGIFDKIKKQISDKYGNGVVEDNRKEEQCIYRNGANFKITSGSLNTKWFENINQTEKIETVISDVVIETCPSNLRHGGLDPIKVRNLTVKKVNSPSSPDKEKNIF